MSRRIQYKSEEDLDEPIINLTPLIDVVFVVLISFMLIAPVLEIDSIELAAAVGTKQEAMHENPLAIQIRGDNSIWFQGEKLSLEVFEKKLRAEKKRSSSTPQLIPDAHCHFETYAKVKNILELAGFEQMDIVLRPK